MDARAFDTVKMLRGICARKSRADRWSRFPSETKTSWNAWMV